MGFEDRRLDRKERGSIVSPSLPISFRSAVRHPLITIRHVTWVGEYVRAGSAGLYRRAVAESVGELRQSNLHPTILKLPITEPVSTLGKLGATQDYLYWLVRAARPSTVVETGVYRGISSAFILAALEDSGGGHLWSVDLPEARYESDQGVVDWSPLPPGESTGFAVPTGLRKRWTLTLGDSTLELPRLLDQLGSIDIFYHDSEHTYARMSWEYAQALEHLRSGGLLVSDDIGWNNAFNDLRSNPRVQTTCVIHGKLGVAVLR